MQQRYLLVASLSGFIAVALGAWVAHSMEVSFNLQQASWFEKAWRYQVFHTLALFALGVYQATISSKQPSARKRAVDFVGIFWLVGLLGFCGGLYALSLGGITQAAMVVPVGGVAFLIGWAGLIYVSIRHQAG